MKMRLAMPRSHASLRPCFKSATSYLNASLRHLLLALRHLALRHQYPLRRLLQRYPGKSMIGSCEPREAPLKRRLLTSDRDS